MTEMTTAAAGAGASVPTAGPAAAAARARRPGQLVRFVVRDPSTAFWSAVFAAMVLLSLLGPFVLPSHSAMEPADRLLGPSGEHWFGTDEYGRDILARTVYAGRVSLGIGLLVTLIAVVCGVLLGAIAAWWKPTSAVVLRLMDGILAFPPIVLAMALLVTLQNGIISVVVGLGIVFTPYIARVVYARVLALKEEGYVTAATASGVSPVRNILVHILPNCAPAIFIQAIFVYANALIADASLSFLGLGVQPPTPTWGNMIGEARYFLSVAPTFILFPGIAIIASVLALNLAGDGLRALIDPRARAVSSLQYIRRRAARRRRGGRDAASGAAEAVSGASAR
ncbi:ABC transporter permease [Brevibacterium album]|uniref:ABC transporter permease n=1 Tax=Brevibacterium album TaxID=417948 RepID=UPI000688757F|nr:ABC transporter permease [Brevibacterium album]